MVDDSDMVRDVLGCGSEPLEGQPLWCQVMEAGRRTSAGRSSLTCAREHARQQLASLPKELQRLDSAFPYSVLVSDRLREEMESLQTQFVASTER